MTSARRAELLALVEAATPGPWEARRQLVGQSMTAGVPSAWATFIWRPGRTTAFSVYSDKSDSRPDAPADPDAVFIAAARTAVPELLAALDEVEYHRVGVGRCDCDHAPCRHDAHRFLAERDAAAAAFETARLILDTIANGLPFSNENDLRDVAAKALTKLPPRDGA